MFDKLLALKPMRGIRAWLYNHHPFGSRITWYSFLTRLGNKVIENDTSERAASVSYSLILAVFPTVIFLFTLIPFIPIPHFDDRIMSFLGEVLPGDTFSTVGTTIRDIVSRPRGNVLSFGFLLALYSATSGLVALMNAFNSSHGDDSRGFLRMRLVAVGLTFALAFALFLAILTLIVGGIVSDYLLRFNVFNNDLTVYLLSVGRYLIVFAVFVMTISVIYRFGPDKYLRWSFITPGSVAASVLIVLTTLGFSYYVSNFGSYNKVYGSIGTLIALMIWINLIALLLILGFETNAILYGEKGERKTAD
ncbi:membrane protein [Spirosoma oryzae]|uniref:Membrane protein n=1 Tax=Spirosoma oryzae TaxID=1469603 RepID=A0A2T0SWB8_9BACT|nr:YihY/virulence factor BrkB family protein [Spirosoma oryzae]PRY37721.1 membrane protein [Spirosoma oryzae]